LNLVVPFASKLSGDRSRFGPRISSRVVFRRKSCPFFMTDSIAPSMISLRGSPIEDHHVSQIPGSELRGIERAHRFRAVQCCRPSAREVVMRRLSDQELPGKLNPKLSVTSDAHFPPYDADLAATQQKDEYAYSYIRYHVMRSFASRILCGMHIKTLGSSCTSV